jgi:tetratricopeptide (TPR) repeat protein
MAEESHAPDAPDLIPLLVSRANALDDLGRSQDARTLLERAVAIAEGSLEHSEPALAVALSNLGSRLTELGDAAAGKSHQLRALEIYERIYGADYAGLAPFLINLGLAELGLGDPAAAKRQFERARELESEALGEDHPNLIRTFLNVAKADAALGATGEALVAAEHALDVAEANAERAPGQQVTALVNVADFLRQETNQLARAEELARLAVERAEETYGREHSETAYALRTLGAVLRLKARAQQSVPVAEESWEVQIEALGTLERLLGPESGPVCDTLSNLGNLLGDVGQRAGSLDLHQQAERIAANIYGDKSPAYARVLANLAIAYAEGGDQERFQELGARAYEIAPWLFTEEDAE